MRQLAVWCDPGNRQTAWRVIVTAGPVAGVIQVAILTDGDGRAAIGENNGRADALRRDALEMLRLSARETPVRIEAQPMPARALMDVRQFAGLIQLREPAAAVNKKHFFLLIHHNAGAWMRNRGDRSAQETNPRQPTNSLHTRSIRGNDA